MPPRKKTAQQVEEPQAKPRRRQKAGRYDDMDQYEVLGKDKGQHYIWANPGARGAFSAGRRFQHGYRPVLASPDGPLPAGWRVAESKDQEGRLGYFTPGAEIVVDDFVLMSIPMDEFEENERYGVGGGSGQEHLDMLERALRQGVVGGVDPLANMASGIEGFRDIRFSEDMVRAHEEY